MANKPISTPLPADLPTNWQTGQTVSPTGTDVGLTQQHGYNYQSQQINDAQTAINAINDAFENVYGDGDVVPVESGGTGSDDYNEGRINIGAASNPNLLDNWYFVGGGSQQGGGQFPINQRGQTSYNSNGYGIDRWKSTNVSAELTQGGITLKTTDASAAAFTQTLGFSVEKDTIFTASILVSSLSDATLVLRIRDSNLSTTYGNVVVDKTGLATVTATVPSGITPLIQIYPNVDALNQPCTITAAKFELGPVQTLAHQDAEGNWILNDSPPNFQQELAKCQRYQVVLKPYWKVIGYGNKSGAQARIVVPVPVPLRTTPTLSVSDYSKIILQKADGTQISPTSGELSLTSDNENQVSILFTLPENTDPSQTYYLMYCNAPDSNPATIIFNANL